MRKIRFEDFIQEEMRDGKELMARMKALEVTSFQSKLIISHPTGSLTSSYLYPINPKPFSSNCCSSYEALDLVMHYSLV